MLPQLYRRGENGDSQHASPKRVMSQGADSRTQLPCAHLLTGGFSSFQLFNYRQHPQHFITLTLQTCELCMVKRSEVGVGGWGGLGAGPQKGYGLCKDLWRLGFSAPQPGNLSHPPFPPTPQHCAELKTSPSTQLKRLNS